MANSRSKKLSKAGKQHCNIGERQRLHTVQSFQVLTVKDKEQEGLQYTEVIAQINTDQSIGKQEKSPKTVEIQIWKPDIFYEAALKSAAKLRELTEKTKSLGIDVPSVDFKPPTREDISKAKSCVFLPFEQFNNE